MYNYQQVKTYIPNVIPFMSFATSFSHSGSLIPVKAKNSKVQLKASRELCFQVPIKHLFMKRIEFSL